MLKVCYFDKEALAKETKHLILNSTKSVPVYEGFQYFSPVDILSLEKYTQFICGYIDNLIIAVIKFHRCTIEKQEQISEHYKAVVPNYLEVRYVDVHHYWQNIGVATALIKGFSIWINQPEIIVISPLTAEGKRANLFIKLSKHLKSAGGGSLLYFS